MAVYQFATAENLQTLLEEVNKKYQLKKDLNTFDISSSDTSGTLSVTQLDTIISQLNALYLKRNGVLFTLYSQSTITGAIAPYNEILTFVAVDVALSKFYRIVINLYTATWEYSYFDADISGKVSIDQGAENAGKAMVVNGQGLLEPQTLDVLKPSDVVNNVTSTETAKPLSANMGKELQDQITNLQTIGRFLAIWNSATGLPMTNPTTLPYTYKTGDYFRVGTVAASGGTNYKPNGASYAGTASTTVETATVETGYVYYYDGSTWLAQAVGSGLATWGNITGTLSNQTDLQAALDAKSVVTGNRDSNNNWGNIVINGNNGYISSVTVVTYSGTLNDWIDQISIASGGASKTWNLHKVTGTNDGTNWQTITIDGTTKSIPTGMSFVTSLSAWNQEYFAGTVTPAVTLPAVTSNAIQEIEYTFTASGTTASFTAPSGYILCDENGTSGLSAGNTLSLTGLTAGSIYECNFKVINTSTIRLLISETKTA